MSDYSTFASRKMNALFMPYVLTALEEEQFASPRHLSLFFVTQNDSRQPGKNLTSANRQEKGFWRHEV
jgi:hypothetical protein